MVVVGGGDRWPWAMAAEVRAATVARAGGATAGCTSSAARAAGVDPQGVEQRDGGALRVGEGGGEEVRLGDLGRALGLRDAARAGLEAREGAVGLGVRALPLAHVEGAEPPGAEPTADVTRGVEGGAEDVQGGRGDLSLGGGRARSLDEGACAGTRGALHRVAGSSVVGASHAVELRCQFSAAPPPCRTSRVA